MRYFISLCFISLSLAGYGQYHEKSFSPNSPVCYGWGCWVGFLKYVPAYFGPNALPVAEAIEGTVDNECEVETRLVGHSANGDNTQNLYLNLNMPIVPKVVAVKLFTNVLEHYDMDFQRREKVQAWHGPGKGFTTGDINLSTIIQVVRNKNFPDVALRFNLRTTTGEHLADARYTDAPGYFFDASFGKEINIDNGLLIKIRPYASGGFYCWQTNTFRHMQNDAIMMNFGTSFFLNKWKLNAEAAGYYGYENNGDRPYVFRFYSNYITKGLTYRFGIQKGLHDNDFTSMFLGLSYSFDISNYMKHLSDDEAY